MKTLPIVLTFFALGAMTAGMTTFLIPGNPPPAGTDISADHLPSVTAPPTPQRPQPQAATRIMVHRPQMTTPMVTRS